jgi:hypothetical protein
MSLESSILVLMFGGYSIGITLWCRKLILQNKALQKFTGVNEY